MNCRRCAVAAALLCAACGKPPVSPSHEPRFAIELPGHPGGLPVRRILAYEGRGSSTQIAFSSLTAVSWRARTPDSPDTLQLDFSAEGSRARIVSYAINLTGKKKLGDHRARLNESVQLTELRDVGYHPFTLRVLPATPPPRPAPALLSNAPSIRIEATEENWDTFTIAVHNLSPHAVVAYAICRAKTARDDGCGASQGTAARPVIPVGGTDERGGFAGSPLVLRCALFDDGSWEGDPDLIAGMKVQLAANDAMHRHIDQLTARILSDPSLDDAARIGRIRAGIDALPEKLAPALIRKALAGVPVKGLTSPQEHILEYLFHNAKWGASANLDRFKPGGPVTLAQFWATTHNSR